MKDCRNCQKQSDENCGVCREQCKTWLKNKLLARKVIKQKKENRLCPVCPELSECPHADNRTECWEYDRAIKKTKEAQQ